MADVTRNGTGDNKLLVELGTTGLRTTGGYIREEWLPELTGLRGIRTYKQMAHDDMIGAFLFANETLLRQVPWQWQPADQTPLAAEHAVLMEGMFEDMSQSWPMFLSEVLSMQIYGWCMPGEQPVLTEYGIPKPIEQIKVGEKVLTKYGRARTVTNTFVRPYQGELISVSIRGYPSPIRMTPEHRLPTTHGWKAAGELVVGDEVLRPRLPLQPGGDYQGGWLVGVYLAEGHRRKDAINTIIFSVHRDEAVILKQKLDDWIGTHLADQHAHVMSLASTGLSMRQIAKQTRRCQRTIKRWITGDRPQNETAHICYPQSERKQNGAHVSISRAEFRALIDMWVVGNSAHTKALSHLPGDCEFVRGLLDGWVWGDGHIGTHQGKYTASAATVSESLAHQMQLLAGSIGYPSPLSCRRNSSLNGIAECFQVGVVAERTMAWKRTPEAEAEVRALRASGMSMDQIHKTTGVSYVTVWRWLHSDKAKQQGFQCRVYDEAIGHPITKVDRVPHDGLVYDLEVEEDHTFCAGPAIVSNCFHEIVYKRRLGDTPPPGYVPNDPAWAWWAPSQYDDGLIGLRKLPIRAQETLFYWEFDASGGVQAMVQQDPLAARTVAIPIDKALLFRIFSHKGNPEGRALAADTPIPTPNGWKLLDDIQVGDKVFDEQGKIRYVMARQEWAERPCYRLKFCDHTEIVADVNHQWITHTLDDRERGRAGRIRTTEELHKTLKTSQRTSNHSIPLIQPLDYCEQHLPVDPYFLGMWLGDGHSNSCLITSHKDDVDEIVGSLEKRGYITRVTHNGKYGGNGRIIRVYGKAKWATDGPSACLRTLGLFNNKHIPGAYLRGSIDQRRALLAGLLDSDGTVDEYGRCEFTNVNMALVQGVAELVRSLGCLAFVGLRHRANGRDHKQDSYAVKFTPDWNPFFLSRKASRIKKTRARKANYIVAIEEIAPQKTICIEVDSPSHLFLAGEGMVPTHNSLLRSAYESWFAKRHIRRIEGIGIERDLAGLPVAWVPPEITDSNASPEEVAQFNYFKTVISNIRRDEQEGIVMPLAYDADGNKRYDLTLLSTGGARQFDTSAIVQRYDTRIIQSVLANVLMMGLVNIGTQALAESLSDLYTLALSTILDSIGEVVNRHLTPRLWKLNALPRETMPWFTHGKVKHIDFEKFTNGVLRLSQAGMTFTPQDEQYIRLETGLPDVVQEEAL